MLSYVFTVLIINKLNIIKINYILTKKLFWKKFLCFLYFKIYRFKKIKNPIKMFAFLKISTFQEIKM